MIIIFSAIQPSKRIMDDTEVISPPPSYIGANETTTTNSPVSVKKCLYCVVVSILVILFTLGLSVGLLYPRDVVFALGNIQIDPNNLKYDLTGFNLSLPLSIVATNNNYFDIDLTEVHITASHPLYPYTLGLGEAWDIVLDRRYHSSFDVPFLVSYKTALDKNSVYLSSLLSNCSAPDASIYFSIHADVDWKMFASSGSKNMDQETLIPCPIDPSTAKKIQTYMKWGLFSGGGN